MARPAPYRGLPPPPPPSGPPRTSPARRAQRDPAGCPKSQRRDQAAEALLGLGGRDLLARGHLALEHAEHGGLAATVLRPGRLGRSVGVLAGHQRQAVAEVHALALQDHPAERGDHTRPDRVAVERGLHLHVQALEALLGEGEAGGVLVEAVEHRPQRGLGLLAAHPVHAQPGAAPAPSVSAAARAPGGCGSPPIGRRGRPPSAVGSGRATVRCRDRRRSRRTRARRRRERCR